MNEAQLLTELVALIRLTFGTDDTVPITRETTALDVDGWDSLSHATLMIMIERRFGVGIGEEESNRIANVGDLVDRLMVMIERKGT